MQEVVEHAFAAAEIDWTKHLRYDDRLVRPTESTKLVGNAAKAKRLLNWEPKSTFEGLIREMTLAEIDLLSNA